MEKYSVLMSVYYKERPEHLRAAVDSMLAQTVPPDDFVLVCDGPLTAELDAVAADFAVRYPQLFNIVRLEKNSGLGIALRTGLVSCRNEWVMRMDSDDLSAPDRAERQLKALETAPGCSLIGGQIAEFTDSVEHIVGLRKVPTDMDGIQRMLPSRNPVNHVTVLLKKSDIEAVGSYCDFPGFEDYHLWSRLLAAGKTLCNLDEVLCYVRVGTDMYGRRGGMRYFRQAKRFFAYMRDAGLIGRGQYIRSLLVRFAGNVLVPNRVRSFLYNKLLRKKI